MKKVLVSGYIGFNNFGDEAIFYVLSNHLVKLGHSVSVLCNNQVEVQKKYQVKTYRFKNPIDIIKAIFNCDVLISGGGSLLQNKTSNFSLIYYLSIILFAKLCFKKVIVFAQGFEPIIGKPYQIITKKILKLVDFVSVRDEKSKDLLLKYGIQSTLLSDPAYYLVQDREINANKNGLIVQLRKFKGINDEFLNNLANSIINNYKGEIKVFSFQDEIDKAICKKFISILNKKNIKAEFICNKPIEETIKIINNSKYMISTRLHGLIISNAIQTKPFALCYDEKIKTLVDELNLNYIDINNYHQDELEDKIKKYFNEESNNINQYRKFYFDEIDKQLK